MKNMILLTYHFPYGKAEAYLETEVNYYQEFDNVDIYSLAVPKNPEKRLISHKNINIYPIFFASKLVYILNTPRVLVDKSFYKELIKLFKQKKLNLKSIKRLIIFIMRARYEVAQISKKLNKNKDKTLNDSGIIYSYRFEYQAYVALLLKKYFPNYKVVARAHRYDLYEYAYPEDYIPLREFILKNLDSVICIAEDGKDYLENRYPGLAKEITVFRLGTKDCGVKNVKDREILRIVSCSNVVKVKRLEKIIEALSLINDIKVHWVHYGNGNLFDEIKQMASEKLPLNITVDFKGHVQNQEVLREYISQEYHVFINVSESEGIPVSIMEALSFGMPVIATNVGGTGEIIKNGYNGILLEESFDIIELKDWIVKFSQMSHQEYQQLRYNARKFWENNYDANKNYTAFSTFLRQLNE